MAEPEYWKKVFNTLADRTPRAATIGPETGPYQPAARNQPDNLLSQFLLPPQATDELGWLAHFRIRDVLGQGGMGMVLLAEDSKLKRRVALKIILPQYAANAQARERFLREAEATAKIKHDNVVTIFQVDEERGIPFIAMELLKGNSLESYLEKEGELSIGEVIRIACEIVDGIAAAHAAGLVHRDIKPANIWLEAPNGRVKILDFGLARDERSDGGFTQTGAVVGTFKYMSPEQADGQKVDTRSDLFSLGVVLYRLLTGRLPFNGATMRSLLNAIARETPVPVRQLNPDVPMELEFLINRLLAKNPSQRVQTATEMAAELAAIRKEVQTLPIAVGSQPAIEMQRWLVENKAEAALPTTPVDLPLPIELPPATRSVWAMPNAAARTMLSPTRRNLFWLVAAASIVLVAGLAALMLWKGDAQQSEPLVVYCAAALSDPMKEIVPRYEQQKGIRIELRFGKSEEILTGLSTTKQGDLFLPADDSYVDKAHNQGLVGDVFPLGTMHAALAVNPNAKVSIASWDDLFKDPNAKIAIGSEGAAIRELTRKHLDEAKWRQLEKQSVSLGSVTEVANAIALGGAVDAGIIWENMVHFAKYRALKIVKLKELEGIDAVVKIAVVKSSTRPKEAQSFARFVSGSCADVFQKFGFGTIGDQALTPDPSAALPSSQQASRGGRPEIVVYAGHEQQCALEAITEGVLIRSKTLNAVRGNVVVRAPSGDLLIKQSRTGSLDAVVAHVSNVKPYEPELEAIKVEKVNCAPTQPIAARRATAHADVVKRLIQAIESAESKIRFEQLGFGWELQP